MDYKGYKLLDKIMLICRDTANRNDTCTSSGYKDIYQAYLVDPSNKKQLESARSWAVWTELSVCYRDAEGNWTRDYEFEHQPVEFAFENNGFELELLDCAGGSSQGGKLSFWNCKVTKDNNSFVIGINSDMLLDLLKNATFDNGKCQSPLIFITHKGKVGMTVEGSETHKQCVKDRELMSSFKNSNVSKFSFGDRVTTATLDEIYLGKIMQYYTFDPGEVNALYHHKYFDIRNCTITKLKKPITHHLFINTNGWINQGYSSIYKERSLSDIITCMKTSVYSVLYKRKTCPKRTISGKVSMDYSEEDFKQSFINSTYDYSAYLENLQDRYKIYTNDKLLYYFLGSSDFGFGFEPFDLPNDIMDRVNAAGIKYIDETV